jgi:hypothetical protein
VFQQYVSLSARVDPYSADTTSNLQSAVDVLVVVHHCHPG